MSSPEANQTGEFASESLRFVESHMHDSTPAPQWVLTSPHLVNATISRALDVGCGAAVHLRSVVDAFGATEGVGLEPSPEVIALLERTYSDDPRLTFRVGSVGSLPFDTDSFDLVMCWSVLHWVGRNEYLQALGELIRVTRSYLLVMDFVGSEDYRVPYSHMPGMFTYKQDFVTPVLASGIMRILEEHRWWDLGVPVAVHPIDVEDLEPFVGNPLNYHSQRGVLFLKDYGVLETFQEADFSG